MAQSMFRTARAALVLAPTRAGEATRKAAVACFRQARNLDARGIGAFACAAMLLMAASPALAQSGGGADPTSIVQAIVNIITGTLGKIIAVAAICVVGIGAMLGAFSARVAGGVILGIILIFSASWIVDQLLGGA
ncbi:TrbC/VirB2 family protein [Sphingobium indicum]